MNIQTTIHNEVQLPGTNWVFHFEDDGDALNAFGEGYEIGFRAGKETGSEDGYWKGYEEGKAAGLAEADVGYLVDQYHRSADDVRNGFGNTFQ